MNTSYFDLYTIVKLFKENKFQKVYVGTDNQNNQAVVINIIYIEKDDTSWALIEENYKNIFNNVVHFERTNDQIVVVTKVDDSLSLNSYLDDSSSTLSKRVYFAYQYLKRIKQYDPLPSHIQYILVDGAQIGLDGERLSFDELLMFSENFSGNMDSNIVIGKIAKVLKKIINPSNINYDELPLYAETISLVDQIQKNNNHYDSLEQLFNEFANLNAVSLIVSNMEKNSNTVVKNNKALDKTPSINEEVFVYGEEPKSSMLKIALSTLGVVTIAGSLFVLQSKLPINKSVKPSTNNVSLDGLMEIDKNTQGKNHEVRSEYEENQESKDPEEENNSDDIVVPNPNVTYSDEDIEQDFSSSKYSDYSLKISSENNSSPTITVNQGPIEADSQLLMWLKSDSTKEIKITVKGYSKGNLSSQQSIVYKPINVNGWELVKLTFNKDIEDSVDIVFNSIDGTIWVDKILIDIFK